MSSCQTRGLISSLVCLYRQSTVTNSSNLIYTVYSPTLAFLSLIQQFSSHIENNKTGVKWSSQKIILLNRTREHHKLVFVTDVIFGVNPKSNFKNPIGFWLKEQRSLPGKPRKILPLYTTLLQYRAGNGSRLAQLKGYGKCFLPNGLRVLH